MECLPKSPRDCGSYATLRNLRWPLRVVLLIRHEVWELEQKCVCYCNLFALVSLEKNSDRFSWVCLLVSRYTEKSVL